MPFRTALESKCACLQIKRMHQDDSTADVADAEAQDATSTMRWTLWALVKMAIITLVCGFIAGEDTML